MTRENLAKHCVCGALGMFHYGIGKNVCQGSPKCGCKGFKAASE